MLVTLDGMSAVFIALITVAGSTVAGLIGYFVARLTNSGQIDTSTADRLWQEAGDMRKELKDQVIASGAEVVALKDEITELKASHREAISGLVAENKDVRTRLAASEEEIVLLRARVAELEEEQKRWREHDGHRPG